MNKIAFIVEEKGKIKHCSYETVCNKQKCSYNQQARSCYTHKFHGDYYFITGTVDLVIREE